ncbi:MAG: hypothetical protein ACTSYR_02330 [Candidatus Odinarchaeia archaeon]
MTEVKSINIIEERDRIKELFIITDGGRLLYHKSFIKEENSPEVIAGFFLSINVFL